MNNSKIKNHYNKFIPFPVDSLPELAKQFVTCGAKIIGCDSSMVALPLLAGIAACIGSAIRLKVNSTWKVPSIIWCCICVKSGSAKSPAQKLTTDILKELQDEERARHRRKYAEQLKAIESNRRRRSKASSAAEDIPGEKRILTTNSTIEGLAKQLETNPGLLVDSDELASWISGQSKYSNGSELNDWLSIYGGSTFTHDRKDTSNSLYVRHPSVSITGGIQPERLFSIFGNEHFDSGLIARFLFTVPPVKKKRFANDDLPPEIRDQVKKRLDDLFNLEPENTGTEEWTPRNILLGNEAQQIYRTFHESHGDETIAAEGALNYAFSKLEEIPLRLAIVLSAFENPMVDEIDASTMVKAIELTNWFKREARRLYAELDPEKKIIDRILGVVEELGKATIRDVQRRIQSLKAFEIEKHINRLVNLNKLGHQDIETGGRPTRVYFLVHGNELSA